MVDSGAEEINLLLWRIDIPADEVQCCLYAVAETDERNVCGFSQGQAVASHGVGVIEHDGIGAELLHVAGDIDKYRDSSQCAEYAAGAERIADTLVDAVL